MKLGHSLYDRGINCSPKIKGLSGYSSESVFI